MLMPPFVLHNPTTVEEACSIAGSLLEKGEDFDWVAGGTDLLPNYKWHLNPKPHVISLARIEGVNTLSLHEIGCMARLADLTVENGIHPLIVEAASKVASSLVRRNATLGGNLCLDTRCFWYNQGEDWRRSIDWCHKADCGTGADCRVVPNQNTLCVATYQGDIAPTLMVLDAEVHLIGPSGLRTMPLQEFYQLDGMKKNVLEKGEFLLKITISESSAARTGSYQKLRVRDTWDFPEAGVAASWFAGDVTSLKVATTALESIPRCHSDEVATVLETDWDGMNSVKALAASIRKSVKPVNNTSLPPRYRKSMVRVLTKRAVEKMLE
ncbi:MAG: FAD binding domain-containing protein [Candidatus Poseidoniaceae archaeon]|nr:FAD binding domain-containing protein [Candidatus Poseidoniaceae archaeon]